MGHLIFIGLGLHDGSDISVRGLKAVEEADVVFGEFYTAMLTGTDLKGLEEILGKKIQVLDREEVEEGKKVLEAAAKKKVVFLCAGDPMSATTHVDLRFRAMESGIRTGVIHGVSIFTAAPSLLGLQHYKFGRTTTVPFPKKGFFPDSPYNAIADNMRQGLHTMVLLDIDEENNKLMTANQAMDILHMLEEKNEKGCFTLDTLVCVVARAGSDEPLVRAGFLRDIKDEDFGPPHHTLVVPGNLHFMESDALVKLAGAPKDIIK